MTQPSHLKRVLVTISFCIAISASLWATPVTQTTAETAATGWLNLNPMPMDSVIAATIGKTKAVTNSTGTILYYVTALDPQGYIILSADDQIDPVIAFSPAGRFDSKAEHPLTILLESDMQDRLSRIPQVAQQTTTVQSQQWQSLINAADVSDDMSVESLTAISDVRVEPFVTTEWGQSDEDDGYCYNYYTPNHYVTGCVATAMAQVIRYHSWPIGGIGENRFQIRVDGVARNVTTRGGDGSGGAYQWFQMPSIPSAGLTETQRQAIGALSYDTGVSVGMSYTATSSSASVVNGSHALMNTFQFSNSVVSTNFPDAGSDGLWTTINSNLNALLPVILGINGSQGGHAVVVDGYGYNGSTMYHHLNMGWSGWQNAWYALPVIDSSIYFNVLNECVYNIYPMGSGEIVSGRVTSLADLPLEGVVIKAYQGTTLIEQETTDSRGIYALTKMPSSGTFRITASLAGYVFADQYADTGYSSDYNASSGNQWDVDFQSSNASPPIASDASYDIKSTDTLDITLVAIDDHQPDPPAALSYHITSLPLHGTLSVMGTPIDSVPYALPATDMVTYQPCVYYGGQDSFTFVANDGGTAPSGGDSNVATITINADTHIYGDYYSDSNSITYGLIDTNNYALRSMALYYASDLGEAQYITDLAMKFHIQPPIPLNDWTIRMQHTDKTVFDDVVNDFITTGWTQVFQGDLSITNEGWVNFHFSQPFYFNGSQNVIIDFSFDNEMTFEVVGRYFVNNASGNSPRAVTIRTTNPSHPAPTTWDFWDGGGSYSYGNLLPSLKLIGNIPVTPLIADFDMSCEVTLPDMATLSAAWNTTSGDVDYNPACDISDPKDNTIDMNDLLVFAQQWLSHM